MEAKNQAWKTPQTHFKILYFSPEISTVAFHSLSSNPPPDLAKYLQFSFITSFRTEALQLLYRYTLKCDLAVMLYLPVVMTLAIFDKEIKMK